jgi:hypothetical protein
MISGPMVVERWGGGNQSEESREGSNQSEERRPAHPYPDIFLDNY